MEDSAGLIGDLVLGGMTPTRYGDTVGETAGKCSHLHINEKQLKGLKTIHSLHVLTEPS